MRQAGRSLVALMIATAATAEPAFEDDAALADPAIARAATLIEREDFAAALPALLEAEARLPDSADVQSLLGFARRKTGDLDAAAGHYARALRLAPRHRGALEYQGELHLMRGDLEAARRNLARLAEICPYDCEERQELAEAIARFEAGEAP